ncbi:hypothetical protein ACQKWADRAFT_279143 [Trichoderma austrokoningii]
MPLQPPPTDKVFTSADEAFQALQDHARGEGYAIVKKRPTSYANNMPRRYDIACVCGNGEYKSQAAGLRKSRTKRTSCPFKMKIVQRKDTGDQWVPGVLCGDHNHAPNLAVDFPVHRRAALTEEQKHNIGVLLEQTRLSARAIIELLKKQYPEILLTEKDVWNMRQKKKWIGTANLNAEVAEALKKAGVL